MMLAAGALKRPPVPCGHAFTGTGTVALAIADRRDADLRFLCEWSKTRRLVLGKTFIKHLVLKDAERLDEQANIISQVEVLFAESPCQDNSEMASLSGDRYGLLGPESGKLLGMLRSLKRARGRGVKIPPLVVIENVTGLLSLPANSGMDLLRATAHAAGYTKGESRVIDAGVWAPGIIRRRVVQLFFYFLSTLAGFF